NRASVGGLHVHDFAADVASTHVARDRRVVPDLAVQREALDDAGTAAQPDVDSAHRLAVEAGNGADLNVEIEIAVTLLGLGVGTRAAGRGADEAARIEHISAHADTQHIVGTAVGLETGLVAFRRLIHREGGVQEFAVLVEFDGALDRCATAVDRDIVEAGRL